MRELDSVDKDNFRKQIETLRSSLKQDEVLFTDDNNIKGIIYSR
jgi:hypothetical protein